MNRSLIAARTALIAQSLLWAVVLSVPGCNNPGSGGGPAGNQAGVNVTAKTPQTINLAVASTSVPSGLTLQFNASVSYTDGTTSNQTSGLIWTSSDPAKLTIDNTGLATAMASGIATIGASDPVSGAKGSLDITVTSAVLSSVTVAPATKSLPAGMTVQLTASGTYSDHTTRTLVSGVSWASNNAGIAAVDANGLVTGVAAGGPVSISASIQGQSGRASVTVTNAELQSISVTPASPSVASGLTVQLSATGNYSNGTSPALASGVSWSSSDSSIAAVDPATGLVTGHGVGAATINASFGGQTGGTPVSVTAAVVSAVIVTTGTVPPPTSTTSTTTTSTPPPTDTTAPPTPVTPYIQATASLAAGQTTQLSAYAAMSDGTTTSITSSVTWSSSDPATATVNATGLVKSMKAGTVTITASYSSTESASVQVTVTPAVLVSISVVPVAALPAGVSIQLAVSGNYTDGTSPAVLDSDVSWSSSDTNIAIVDSSGTVTGKNQGTVTITGTFEGLTTTVSVRITSAQLTGISISPDSASMPVGLTGQLTANVSYTNGTVLPTSGVTWASSDITIATVSEGGRVLGKSPGKAFITASIGSVSTSIQVNVTQAVLQSVGVSPGSAEVVAGLAVQLTASGNYSDGSTPVLSSGVIWTSSSNDIATVTATGVVSGVAAGSAVITASYGGSSSTSAVKVTAPQLLSVSVSPPNASIPAGLTVQLSALGNFNNGQSLVLSTGVTWSSSSIDVATVSSTGLVTGHAPGPVTITASSGVNSGTSAVTVTDAVLTAVSVSPPSASVVAGLTVQLTASGTYTNGTTKVLPSGVTWTSSSNSIATVDSTGLVKGVAAGTANVTAGFGGFTSAPVPVAVTGATLSTVSVNPSAASVPEGLTVQLTAYGNYTDGSSAALSSGVTWSSSNTKVATVSSSGLVTGRQEGTVTITASSGGRSGAATLTVTEHEMESISITPANVSLAAGLTVQLKVLAGMSDSTALTLTTSVTWTSDSLNVATVSSSGLVTGVSPGTAKITASVGKNSDTINVIVTAAQLQSVSVTPTSAALAAGTTVQLAAKASYSDGAKVVLNSGVTWSSDNTRAATVSGAGVVTGVAAGSANITAGYGGIAGASAVTVTAALLQSIAVTPASASVVAGSTVPLTATGTFSDNSKAVLTSGVNWSSDNPAAATVNSAGVVTGAAAGSATITASSGGAVGASIVTVPQPSVVLQSILITAPNATLSEDMSLQMTANGVYSDGSSAVLTAGIAWTSNNLKVATVNGSGLVTGVDEGTVTITVRDTATGISKSVSVSITEEEDNDGGGGGSSKGKRHSRINRWW